MAMVTLQTAAEIEAQKSQTSSAGQAKDLLAGMNVLTAEGQEPGQKGIQITEKALKRRLAVKSILHVLVSNSC